MGTIQNQYLQDGEDAYSLETRVRSLCEHPHLNKRDIMDVGLRLGANGLAVSQDRFIVKEPLLTKITNVAAQMQELCSASADALRDKKKGYVIDPENTMLPILSGAKSVGDLERAWRLLIQRLSRAQDKLDRNFKIYKQEDLPPHSPATTDPQIYEDFKNAREPDSAMTHLYRSVPSMNRLLTEEERSRLDQGRELRSAISSPFDLKAAFPDRTAESNPREIYYNEDGAKITSVDPDSLLPRRTSNIASNHPQFEFPTSDSASQAYPGHQRRGAWGGTSDRGYETAPTSMVHPAPKGANQLGLLDGISSAYQRFPGSSQNWAPSRPSSEAARREIDITDDPGRRPFTAWSSYMPSYPSQPPADPPNFTARFASAGGDGHGGDDDDSSSDSHSRGGPGPNPFPSSNRFNGGPPARQPLSHGGGGPYGGGSGGPPGGGPPGGGSSGPSGPWGAPRGPPGNNGLPAPYGNHTPTIKTDLKLSDLPKWDGDFDTAIAYFHKISELASMGGDLPVALGFWLGQTLEKDSPVEEWYMALSPKWKTYMRAHYLNYVETIKYYFLGRPWQQKMQFELETQRFRQTGHEKETPHHYFIRRIRFVRMFLQVPPDSSDEVYHVTMNMPIGWNQHLTPATISDTTTLQLRARELQDALINSAVSTAANLVTADNILAVLQKAGYQKGNGGQGYTKSPSASSSYRRYNPRVPKVTAHAVEGTEPEEEELENTHNDPSIAHQAFAVMKRGEPPPSRRGPFPFDKQDQVHTSIGRLPAWPCRACGSANHWDRECPMWDRFQSKVKSAKWVEAGDPEEDGQLYTQVYQTFLAQIEDSTCVLSEEREDADQPLAEKEAALNQASSVVSEGNTPTILRKSSVEDVEDEDQLAQQRKPKARGASALEDADDEPVEAEAFANYSGIPSHSTTTGTPSHQTEALDPPLADTDPIRIPKRKKAAPGKAAVGTSVLSVRGRVNRLQEREIDLWLDSGADVSLISQDFLESLKVKPAIRQGMKMRLWQLTSKNETLAGYVNVPLFIQAEDGTMLETEVEAYVVPGMSVDILLGEDYQLCHEIAIRRSVETGTRIEFGGLPYCVKAVPVSRTKDFERLSSTHYGTASYVKAKAEHSPEGTGRTSNSETRRR